MLLNKQHIELMLPYQTVYYGKAKVINLTIRGKGKLYYMLVWVAMANFFSTGVCGLLGNTVHLLLRSLQWICLWKIISLIRVYLRLLLNHRCFIVGILRETPNEFRNRNRWLFLQFMYYLRDTVNYAAKVGFFCSVLFLIFLC